MSDQSTPSNPDEPGLPPEFAEIIRGLSGGADLPPELAAQMNEQIKAMGLGNLDASSLQVIAQQVQAMLNAPSEGPVNATLATDIARKTVAAEGDPSMSQRERDLAGEAGHVASLWLDAVTSLEAPALKSAAMSRAEWVEATMPLWRDLVTPIAAGVGSAMAGAFRGRAGGIGGLGEGELPEELKQLLPPGTDPAALLGQLEPMFEKMSSSMFSVHLGQAVGTLAGDVLTGTEICLPLVAGPTVALLPTNIAEFAEGLEVDTEQVWLYLTVREAARKRLFTAVPWLGPQILVAVQDYARDISIDVEGIQRAVEQVDPSNPEQLQEALSGSLFAPEPSPAQAAALLRLETWLALIEGWVDVVSERATTPHLPQVGALTEAVRRRRATGGPAERTFAELVGLELRPRRLRDAANLWSAVEAQRGSEARDHAWAHPDLAPTALDLDDPLGYLERLDAQGRPDEVDAALEAILRGDPPGTAG